MGYGIASLAFTNGQLTMLTGSKRLTATAGCDCAFLLVTNAPGSLICVTGLTR